MAPQLLIESASPFMPPMWRAGTFDLPPNEWDTWRGRRTESHGLEAAEVFCGGTSACSGLRLSYRRAPSVYGHGQAVAAEARSSDVDPASAEPDNSVLDRADPGASRNPSVVRNH